MGIIEKTFAVVMIPLGILIILDVIGFFSLRLPFDLALLGAVLMIIFQVFNLVMLRIRNKILTTIQIITFMAFVVPALAYIALLFFSFGYDYVIVIVLGVMLFVEALYVLH